MGAWGVLAFDNDQACDWAAGLSKVSDLSLVMRAFAGIGGLDDEQYLDAAKATKALAACEVLARLKGNPGYKNPYTQKVDAWVAAHPMDVAPGILARAQEVIDRVLCDKSELRRLWEQGDETEWRQAVDDLRRRLRG